MFDRILGLTMPWALKKEAVEYSKKFGYPASPDAVTGKPNMHGQGDVRDAFRHLYGTAVLAYEGGITPGRDIAEFGELLGRNPEFLAEMDRKNNAIAIGIARRVRKKYEGNFNVTEATIKDEIAKEANSAISSGKASFFITRDNDSDFTPPIGIPDSSVDNLSGFDSFGNSIGDLLGSISDGIGSAFSTVSYTSMGSTALGLAMPVETGGSGFDATSLQRIFAGGGRGRSNTLNQVIFTTAAQLTQQILKAQRGKLEDDLIDIFTGGNGTKKRGGITTPPFIPGNSSGGGNPFSNILGGVFENMIGAAFNRQRTTSSSRESTRSQDALAGYSQSQQAAFYAQWLQQGNRNL